MDFTIKELQKNQIEKAIKFHNHYLGKSDFMNSPELKKRLKTKKGIFLVAEDNKTHKIIGIKFGYFESKQCIGRGVAVLTKWRRKGVGSSLILPQEIRLL